MNESAHNLLCRCTPCAQKNQRMLDEAWWETSEAYHDSIKAGQADADLSWKAYCLGQLRSAYYLYVDSIEETK